MYITKTNPDITIPNYLKQFVVGINVIRFENDYFPYLIVDQTLEPGLLGFVSYNTGTNLLFISEEVPEEFRPFFLVHELIEFRQLEKVAGRCKIALKRELSFVPDEMRVRYLEYRTEFFHKLFAYNKKDERHKPEFLEEIKGSLNHLILLGG